MATWTGDSTNNERRGTAENNVLKGLGGNDILWGLGGNDKLEGGDDNDVLIGGTGSDWLYGGAGNDVLVDRDGGAYRDRLFGEAGDDVLVGDRYSVLRGGAGADVLVGLGGGTAFYSRSEDGVTVNLATGRGAGGDAEGDVLIDIHRVVGSNEDDTLTGDEQDNYFIGKGGADVLDGGGGIDTAGYNAGGGVTVDLGVKVNDRGEPDENGWTIGKGGNAEGDKLKNIENLDGHGGDDTLRGDQNDNELYGGGGDDVLEGRGGADRLNGYRGNDTASYAHSPGGVTVDLTLTGAQPNTKNDGTSNHDAAGDTLESIENLEGSEHADTLTGNGEANWLTGRGGNDTLKGGAGSDTLDGGTDNDILEGGAGNDLLEGGAAADILRGGDETKDDGKNDIAAYSESAGGVTVDLRLTGPQLITNADGTSNHDAAGDTLVGIEGLDGSIHADKLIGNGETNELYGDEGNDTLMGEGGDDKIDGGPGQDTLWGGTGADTFVFYNEGDVSADVVKDFSGSGGQGDKLDLSGLKLDMEAGTTLTFRTEQGAAFTGVKGQVRYFQDKGNTHVQVDLDGEANADGEYEAEFEVTLEGVHTVTDGDLILA